MDGAAALRFRVRFPHLLLMRLSDHTGPLEISGRLSFGLLLFGFALEGQGLLELLGDVEAVEVPWSSDHRLEGKGMDILDQVRIYCYVKVHRYFNCMTTQ